MTWSITDLGLLPGGIFSIAQAASSDGSVIVGVADADGFGDGHAFWWTQDSGLVDLGVLSGGTQSIAYAVSADGQYVVGQSDGGSASSPNVVAVLWHVTAGGGTVVATELGYLGTGQNSVAWGISADGTTVSGSSMIIPGNPLVLPAHAFSWTSGGGMVAIALNGANTTGIGQAPSANGSVIVGGSDDPADVPWKSVSGTVSSVPMPGGEVAGVLVAVDAAGDAMAGFSTTTPGGNLHAYRWTSGGGASLLGFLGTGDASDGLGISGDGSIVVGFSNNGVSIFNQAFVWNQADGMQALPGLNVGAPGGAAQGISSDGLVIVGSSRGNDTPEPVLHAVYWTEGGPPPSGGPVTMAELWFASTGGFVDMAVESNRRKFISVNGGAQDLGETGEAPFGVTPPAYLSRRGPPATFAVNNGRGGQFITSGGTLTVGATNPPGVASSTTVATPFRPGQGILGDYRNGNLYAFNPATYTDNGTRRKWVRRWRALPQGSIQAKSFHYLAVSMETGAGVLDSETPQLMLRWSDDGGNTWSNYRILPVGPKGATTFTVKANRMGMTRRFSGSDRIFELSSTDPFKVAILDADIDVS